MVPRQDSSPRPMNRKSDALPIAPPRHSNTVTVASSIFVVNRVQETTAHEVTMLSVAEFNCSDESR